VEVAVTLDGAAVDGASTAPAVSVLLSYPDRAGDSSSDAGAGRNQPRDEEVHEIRDEMPPVPEDTSLDCDAASALLDLSNGGNGDSPPDAVSDQSQHVLQYKQGLRVEVRNNNGTKVFHLFYTS
jgi:hypothetical protein